MVPKIAPNKKRKIDLIIESVAPLLNRVLKPQS
jgi:hypothetical protein